MMFPKHKLIIATVQTLGSLSLSAARSLGSALGSIAYYLNTRNTKVTRRNLDLCLPHLNADERKVLLKKSLQETGKLALEICVLWHKRQIPAEALIVKIEGEELAQAALAKGKGLIILAPHLGNWEVLGLHLVRLGKVTNLYQPPKMAELEGVIRKGRERSGAQLVPTNTKGVAALLKSLKDNGISGILPDQNPNDAASGVFAPFFGHPAFTMILVHKLIQRTDCTAVLAFAKRVPNGFEIIYRTVPEEIYSDDQNTAIAAMNQGIEALVMEAPEQYQWEYKRFKRVPEGGVYHYHDC